MARGEATSADGTRIAFDRQGDGPPLVLVTGGLDDGAETAPLARELAAPFTTFNLHRRGRGASADGGPPALAREIEDLAAVADAAGATPHLYGVSSGGALVLEAAAAGLPAGRLAVYEVPYLIDEAALAGWRAYVARLSELLAADRRGDAVEAFMRLAGASDANVAAARRSPLWPRLEALAPTLAHDAACLGDGRPPAERLARIARPVLVLTGGVRPEDAGFFERAADAIAASLPHGRRRTLAGQGHVVDARALAPVLARFLAA